MKHIVRKAYWNYEKEEIWLNQMAVKGMALTDYSWCRYVFQECPKGEYIYRIELLNNLPTHPESIAYIRFLEDSGVECIATYFRWVYFRKKAADGPFDIYSDIDSRITHYKRVSALWNVLAAIEFSIGILNIGVGIVNVLNETEISGMNLILAIPVCALGFMLVALGAPLRKKIKKLNQEKLIRE